MQLENKQELQKLFDRYPRVTLDRFKKFHAENPDVYAEFKKLALQMRSSGRTKYSAETIVNVIRWHRDIQTAGDVFEINNDFRSIYVRLLIYHHPEFLNFFELRQNAPNRGLKSQEQIEREGEYCV